MPSRQLNEYLRLRTAGESVAVASERSGIGLAEAQLSEEAIASGELALPPMQEARMGGLTNEEEEREQPQPHIAPKIDDIAKLVGRDGQLDKLEEKMATARGAIAQKYQHIENDLHGNRKAVKIVRNLLGMTTDAAYDFMRTFLRLAGRFDLLPSDDLVDLAEQVDKPKVEAEPGVSAADLAPKSGEVHQFPSRENAIDRHTKALAGGDKPPAPKGPPGDTDLVEAGDAVAQEIEEQRRKDAEAFEGAGAAPAA